jgi:O-antigen biosynthesis protein
MTRVRFPKVPNPRVSVLVVTYGAADELSRAMRALAENTEPVFEVIVVDNGSPPPVLDILHEGIDGARVFENGRNLGFGPACNQAAGYARGEFLLFLNSDAFVHPGWLPPLLETLESDSEIAAVGPRVLNLDGTLQEAGCLLFRDGRTAFRGFGEDPEKAEYLVPKVVAYCSASCLLVRRRAFQDVGGFDAIYAPAYLEDVDMCLAFAERGWKTVYEPRSVVTHARGASSNEKDALEIWSRNYPVFVARWRHRLGALPPFPEAEPRSST